MGFALISAGIAVLAAIAFTMAVLYWEQASVLARFGADNAVMSVFALSAGRVIVLTPISTLARIVATAPTLMLSSALGRRAMTWRTAIRVASYGSAYLVLLAIPLLGLPALFLGPRFLTRAACGDISPRRAWGVGVVLWVVWLGVGFVVGGVFDLTLAQWVQERSLEIVGRS